MHQRTDVGPLKWMAPESAYRQEYSHKSDSWAWAVTIWELLTHQEPYADKDAMAAAIAVR